MNFNQNLQKFTKNGKILMLALDHRTSFENMLVNKTLAVEVKKEIINSLQNDMSAILVDQDYGLKAFRNLNSEKAFLLPIESSGFEEAGGERITKLQYSIDEIIAAGASGVKLLIYFNPKAKTAIQQMETAKAVMVNAQKRDLPFFLEVVTYNHKDDEYLILESLEMLLSAGIKPDVYKIEYPGSPDNCQKVNKLLGDIPWILLTKGGDYELFEHHLRISKESGCSGFLAGRSLWQEGVKMESKEERIGFFNSVAKTRFQEISRIMQE